LTPALKRCGLPESFLISSAPALETAEASPAAFPRYIASSRRRVAGSASFYRTAFDAAVKFNVDKGVLPSGKYDADDVIWASGVYHDLVALKQAADDLLKRAEGSNLSAQNQALLEKAKQFYAWYDYLDAYRLLRVAVQ
jgi:hypothetical protein